jgi:hypothetical protein
VADDEGIEFFVDEHFPVRRFGPILIPRGHTVKAVHVGFKDPSILVTADEVGAVIITADAWFLRELFRYPIGHHKRFQRAGVVQLAGELDVALSRLGDYIPVIEALHRVRRAQADPRLGIDLSGTTIRIEEARPGPVRGDRRGTRSA